MIYSSSIYDEYAFKGGRNEKNNRLWKLILTKEGGNIEHYVELEDEASLIIPNELMLSVDIPLKADIDVICQKIRY